MDYTITKIEKHTDDRGDLVVFLKKNELHRNRRAFGQIYFITFKKKGMIRGNHYHKRWREWFGVVTGVIQAELEDIWTKKRVSLILDSQHSYYVRLEIGPNIAHAFKSLTPQTALLNYGDKEWSAQDKFIYKLM